MKNIFNTITETLPKPTEEQQQKLTELSDPGAKPKNLSDVVLRWQKNETPEDTAYILEKLKPTISSALNSYAPGMEKQLEIKAQNLALDAMRTYKPDTGANPQTFAFNNLKRLNRLNAKAGTLLPLTEKKQLEMKFLLNTQADLQDQLGREPTYEELANRTGFNTRKVEKLLNGRTTELSGSAMTGDESHDSLVKLNDMDDDDYFEYVYASVSPIDQKIMEWQSGLHGSKVLPNNVIAQKLKISPAAVSQRKGKIQQMLSEVRGML